MPSKWPTVANTTEELGQSRAECFWWQEGTGSLVSGVSVNRGSRRQGDE